MDSSLTTDICPEDESWFSVWAMGLFWSMREIDVLFLFEFAPLARALSCWRVSSIVGAVRLCWNIEAGLMWDSGSGGRVGARLKLVWLLRLGWIVVPVLGDLDVSMAILWTAWKQVDVTSVKLLQASVLPGCAGTCCWRWWTVCYRCDTCEASPPRGPPWPGRRPRGRRVWSSGGRLGCRTASSSDHKAGTCGASHWCESSCASPAGKARGTLYHRWGTWEAHSGRGSLWRGAGTRLETGPRQGRALHRATPTHRQPGWALPFSHGSNFWGEGWRVVCQCQHKWQNHNEIIMNIFQHNVQCKYQKYPDKTKNIKIWKILCFFIGI